VPRALQELNGKMGPTIERLTARLGRSPSIAEIAKEFQTSPEQVLEAMEAGSAYAPQSLSAGPDGDSELDPMETIGTEDVEFARTDERTSLEPALELLPEREQLILKLRFEEGLTQTQIAEKIGISQMHVSRLIRRSLERMRAQLT
jgi:RNA polymerase sigma-B factor